MKPCELIGNILLAGFAIVGAVGVGIYVCGLAGMANPIVWGVVGGVVLIMAILATQGNCNAPVEDADDTLGIGA